MEYLPLFFDVRGRTCAVVGGDESAARRAELLLRAGARVRVFADALGDTLAGRAGDARVEHVPGPLASTDLAGCALVVIALDDADAAAAAAALAAARGIPVNVVDRPELGNCITPAIVDRSPVLVAITTGGASPVLGRLLRARLEALLPVRLGELAALAQDLRPQVVSRLPRARRRGFWEAVLQGPIAELAFAGRGHDARARMLEHLSHEPARAPGEAYLVATPPDGDPEGMTLRALRLLQQADVVIHDDALPQPLLDLVRRDAERRAASGRTATDAAGEVARLARGGRRAAWLTDPANLRAGGDGTAPAAAMRAQGICVHESL